MILEMAERDAVLFRRLDLAAMTVHADEKTLTARLRKVIDGAIRTAGYIEYREAAGWAADVKSALNTVADLAQGRHAGIAIGLIERAMARLEKAIAGIDDSDGHCGALLHHARDIHLDACRATTPDPVALARRLFEREMADDYDVFSGAAAIYADVLGEDGLAEYRRLATEAWDKLPPRIGHGRGEHEFSGDNFSAGAHPRLFHRARRRCGGADRHPRQGPVLALALSAIGRVMPARGPSGRGAAPGRGGVVGA